MNGKGLILLIFLIIFLCSSAVRAQIPSFTSNVSEKDKLTSPIYQNFASKYEFLIAYKSEGFWSKNVSYAIIAYANNKWYKLLCRFKINKNDKWSKPKIQKSKLMDSYGAKVLIDSLTQLSFWNMSQDSLNINSRTLANGEIIRLEALDGISYSFTFFAGKNLSVIYANNPQLYLEHFPEITIRKRFIRCLNIFNDAYDSK